MRLTLVLPGVRREEFTPPSLCPYEDCQGSSFRLHQQVTKLLNDTVYPEVAAYRYQCLTCGRTFRVYPEGVNKAQTSLRVKRLAVMLYLMGLSYRESSVALEAFGVYISKSQVYEAVQALIRRNPDLRRRQILERVRRPVVGEGVVSVKRNGGWLSLQLAADGAEGTALTVGHLSRGEAETLTSQIAPIAKAVGAQLLVNDEAGVLQWVAGSFDVGGQVWQSPSEAGGEAPPDLERAWMELVESA